MNTEEEWIWLSLYFKANPEYFSPVANLPSNDIKPQVQATDRSWILRPEDRKKRER